jgi:hypothetical protein
MTDNITVRASSDLNPAVVAITAQLQDVVVEMFGPKLVALWRDSDRSPGRYFSLAFVMGKEDPDGHVMEFTVTIHIDAEGEITTDTVGFSGPREELDKLDLDAELAKAEERPLSEVVQGLVDEPCECGICAPKGPAALH